jgi:hypothetical protein
MHTLELDQKTEQSLNQLAALSGQTPDELLHEITISSIQSRLKNLTSASESLVFYDGQESNQATDWNNFFATFCTPVVDHKPCNREEIYAECLR